MKKLIYILLIVIIIAIYLFPQNGVNNVGTDLKPISTTVCIESNCFDVEIADTPQKREIGLMNRKNMLADDGMFFIFEKEGIHNFWMKNTLIPLDIIWIDMNDKIIFIQKNAQPCKVEQCESFGPNQKAKYVLEINSGLAEEMGIEAGNKIILK